MTSSRKSPSHQPEPKDSSFTLHVELSPKVFERVVLTLLALVLQTLSSFIGGYDNVRSCPTGNSDPPVVLPLPQQDLSPTK